MHRGTDFAAPSGTPIMASGSGTITRARWCGGGGNCVKIKHNSTYETIYAHMKAFAKGVERKKSKTRTRYWIRRIHRCQRAHIYIMK